MKRTVAILGVSSVGGAIVGAFMSYAAARHNPQGEFNSATGHLEMVRLAPVFLSWFVIVFVALAAIGCIWQWLRHRNQTSSG